MKNFYRNLFLFLLFFLWGLGGFGWGAYSQLYPVQLTPVFNSPYSVKLSDYATSMDTKMQLLINPTDISINNRQVRLKFSIQGNGINAQSSGFIQGQNPIFINGGELQTLTNVDIAALFRLENLEGISAVQYANPLPEGMYNFCFELYDFITNQKISQKSCASLYLILNDPPLLNTPQRNEQIASTEFPNILFTWTPRQINATNVSYKFELKQLIDPTLDPQFGFQMTPILYEETLFGTALLYNLNMPILSPGMRYAWRVRAISTTGLSESAVFKNDGYSEIYSFKYTGSCAAPTFVLSEAQGNKSVKISWQGIPEHTRYQIQYKKQDVRNAQWFSVYSLNTQSLITNLEPGVTYQFRVGSSCDPATDGVQSFTYSGISTFTTPTETKGVPAYNCGIIPKIEIQNQKPLDNLIQSETFKAGDFPVTVLELEGHNPYSGRGYIIVPYLADTKIAVEFKNIVVNTDYQLISGVVETSYNPDWKNVTDLEDFTGEGEGGQIEETVPFEISTIVINANGDIVVNGKNNEQITIPGGKDTVITDEKGKVYTVDSKGNGNNEGVVAAEGGKSTPENTDGVDATGQATVYTAKGISIQFTGNGSKYAFDVMPKDAPKDVQKLYIKVGSTPLPYKAVENGDSDTLFATVTLTDTAIKLEDIVFKTQNGALIKADIQGSGFVLTVKGNQTYAEEQVLATIKQGDKWKVIGAFMLVHISPKEVNVVLVPLNKDTQIPASAEENLQSIYKTVGIKLNITRSVKVDYSDADGKIEAGDSDFLESYTAEEQTINQKIKSLPDYKTNAYYLIYSDLPASKADIKGFMALKGQYGYIFPKAPLNTGAHELGHGALGLEHPFKTEAEKGKTNFLMDYADGTVLWHNDWKQINDPKFRLYMFQGDSEGELAGGFGLTPNFEFVSAGESNIVSTKTNLVNEGMLSGFRDANNVKYIWNKGKNAYTINGTDTGQIYPLAAKKAIAEDAVVWLIYNYSEDCKQIKYIHTKYNEIVKYISFSDKTKAQEGLESYIKLIAGTTEKQNPIIYSGVLGCDNSENENINRTVFAINKSTFKLPDEYSVIGSDINEISKTMVTIIDNDRRDGRKDKEDQSSDVDLVPSDKNAEEIYKEVATLWNNYENVLYSRHLIPAGENTHDFNVEKEKLEGKKLLMPSLIADGSLGNISERFLQDFFRNKIKGYANSFSGLFSLYKGSGNKEYEQAGSNLVDHFYKKTRESYYETKTIADAIYKTEKGKEKIDNMIKLVDQVFQYKMAQPKIELSNNKFLEAPLDNKWFDKGIDSETFPRFEADVLKPYLEADFSSPIKNGTDEEKLGLFCIGGTQAAKVAVKYFKPIIEGNNVGYEATVVVQYLDTFGVSESDFTKDLGLIGVVNLTQYNYRGGVMAQWVLQHQYGYKPFDDYLTYIVKMKKLWKK